MSVANAHSDDEDEEDNDNSSNNTMRHNWYDEQFPYNMDISTGHVILVSLFVSIMCVQVRYFLEGQK